nr:uncharacterized protein LOC123002675 [Drosophila takahashii]
MSRASYSQDYIKAQIDAGVLRFSNKRSRSKVWDVFARIEDQSGAAIQDIVMCRTCNSLMKYHGCTSNMVRHKCYRTKVFSPQAEDPLGSSYEEKEEEEEDPSRDSSSTDKVTQAVMEWCLITERDLEPDDDLFSDFVATDSQEDKIAKEIRGYQAIQMAYTEGFNVLDWWHSNRQHFPLLYKTSCQILSIPASKEPSALVLSQASSLIKDPSCGMDELHRVMFLKTNVGEGTEHYL